MMLSPNTRLTYANANCHFIGYLTKKFPHLHDGKQQINLQRLTFSMFEGFLIKKKNLSISFLNLQCHALKYMYLQAGKKLPPLLEHDLNIFSRKLHQQGKHLVSSLSC